MHKYITERPYVDVAFSAPSGDLVAFFILYADGGVSARFPFTNTVVTDAFDAMERFQTLHGIWLQIGARIQYTYARQDGSKTYRTVDSKYTPFR